MKMLFEFTPRYKKGKVGREQLRHAIKDYPHACERCGGDIHKGELYVTVSEYMLMGKSYYAHHYEPHRLCENCLEELEESKKEELRPFNRAELETLLGELVVEKSTGNKWLVEGFTIDNMLVINRSRVSATKLLSEYTYKGKPCGVKE